MIKYIGSKRELVSLIVQSIDQMADVRTVLDPFSGTSRVAHALKKRGYRVIASDYNAYAHTLATCYVQADYGEWAERASLLIRELNAMRGSAGYFTETFCIRSRFFQPNNGERIDAIREAIERKGLEPELKAIVLTSLMEAADRVDSTTGLQMAYLKEWAPRAHNDLELRLPKLAPRAKHGRGEAHLSDALDAVQRFEVDVVYLDPPYNQHSYLGNYHVWETLVRWDKPQFYGVACKRVDCKERKSVFNSRPRFQEAFRSLVRSARARHLVVSFNNEGYLSHDELCDILATRGAVSCLSTDYKRYVGAQIGIYNPKGKRVGEVTHLRNKEFLFIAGEHVTTIAVPPSPRTEQLRLGEWSL